MSNETPTDALRLVPVEPTEAMLDVGRNTILEARAYSANDRESARAIWAQMLAAAPASPLPEGGGQFSGITGELKSGEDILWMMHVRGPDDIYPAPDYETAVAWCDYVNDVLAKPVPEVMTKAVPAIWTLSPQEHAVYLPEAIKGWALPAAPTGDAPVPDRFANDEAAKALYDSWSSLDGWVPWVERGNSDIQEEARRLAVPRGDAK